MMFVTALHGTEPLPVFALASLGENQIVAHPRALAAQKRFLEEDMNKSFGLESTSLEALQARKVLSQIPKDEEIIDFHTMSAISDPFAIVVDEEMIPLAQTLGLKHIVLMRFNVKAGHALINHRRGVSVECGLHDDYSSFEVACSIVKNAKAGIPHQAKLYEVFGTIENSGEYENFVLHADGFIPVLAGEKAYNFPGLKARLLET